MDKKQQDIQCARPSDISDDDILEAMKEIGGYLDITPGDFKEVFRFAYNHAVKRLTQSLMVKDIMTKEVVFVRKDTSLKDVAETMARYAISGVPVLGDGDTVVGVISEKDFLFHMGAKDTNSFMRVVTECLSNPKCVAPSLRKRQAQDIMTSPAITVSEDTLVSEVAQIFGEKTINRAPVINRQGKLAGIVSRADILQASLIKDEKAEPKD
jgi:CBS domain-containing membrane protein